MLGLPSQRSSRTTPHFQAALNKLRCCYQAISFAAGKWSVFTNFPLPSDGVGDRTYSATVGDPLEYLHSSFAIWLAKWSFIIHQRHVNINGIFILNVVRAVTFPFDGVSVNCRSIFLQHNFSKNQKRL